MLKLSFRVGPLVQMVGVTVHTTDNNAYAVYSKIGNGSNTNTVTATARLFAGDITTTGTDEHGINKGWGDIVVSTAAGSTLTASGANSHGIATMQDNTTATGSTTIMIGGNIMASGNGINVNSQSSGTVVIAGNGNITGGSDVGNDGISVNGDPGITVTTADGTISITGNGDVTGTV